MLQLAGVAALNLSHSSHLNPVRVTCTTRGLATSARAPGDAARSADSACLHCTATPPSSPGPKLIQQFNMHPVHYINLQEGSCMHATATAAVVHHHCIVMSHCCSQPDSPHTPNHARRSRVTCSLTAALSSLTAHSSHFCPPATLHVPHTHVSYQPLHMCTPGAARTAAGSCQRWCGTGGT